MDFVSAWRERGLLAPEQAELLSRIESGRLFSISAELRALLYLGALLVVAGVGATVKWRFLELGPAAITAGLSLAAAACLAYCFLRAKPYSPEAVEPPTLAFDYVLYLGCALVGILFGYLELKFHLLAELWEYYLLASSGLLLWLAYRFDNRLVLVMGLVNLGAWFGIRPEHWWVPAFGLRARALAFGALLLGAGAASAGAGIKRHFRDSYCVLGLHILFWALLSGIFDRDGSFLHTLALAALAGGAAYYALELRSFQYFLAAAVYGYIGLSHLLLSGGGWGAGSISLYFLLSSIGMIVLVFSMRRRLEQRE